MSIYLTNFPSLKKKTFLLLLLLAAGTSLFAQDGLVVKNKKTGRAWMYEKYARVTYICFNEQEYHTGILNALLDSAVVFGTDTVALKNISGLRRKNPTHTITRVIGLPLMLIGSICMGQGAANLYSQPESGNGIKYLLIGAGIFAIGYIPYELSPEELTVGLDGKWVLQIQRGNPQK